MRVTLRPFDGTPIVMDLPYPTANPWGFPRYLERPPMSAKSECVQDHCLCGLCQGLPMPDPRPEPGSPESYAKLRRILTLLAEHVGTVKRVTRLRSERDHFIKRHEQAEEALSLAFTRQRQIEKELIEAAGDAADAVEELYAFTKMPAWLALRQLDNAKRTNDILESVAERVERPNAYLAPADHDTDHIQTGPVS